MNSGNSAMNPYALVYSTASNAGIHRGMSLPFCMSPHVESAKFKICNILLYGIYTRVRKIQRINKLW